MSSDPSTCFSALHRSSQRHGVPTLCRGIVCDLAMPLLSPDPFFILLHFPYLLLLYAPSSLSNLSPLFPPSLLLPQVTIDDRLPVGHRGEPLCSHSSNCDEFWISLIEKAYIKVSSKCPSFLPKASVGIQSREEPREVFCWDTCFCQL